MIYRVMCASYCYFVFYVEFHTNPVTGQARLDFVQLLHFKFGEIGERKLSRQIQISLRFDIEIVEYSTHAPTDTLQWPCHGFNFYQKYFFIELSVANFLKWLVMDLLICNITELQSTLASINSTVTKLATRK